VSGGKIGVIQVLSCAESGLPAPKPSALCILKVLRHSGVCVFTPGRNWDFVGNDIPVFFIRDGIKFVDLVHSLKPSPKKHLQEGWRVLDFLSHHPESCHIVSADRPLVLLPCMVL
jgi:Catalase